MKVENCRMCHCKNLQMFLDLGHHPPSDEFRKLERLNEAIPHYPLQTVICEDCGLVQLNYVVPGDILYQNDYPYESSMTKIGKIHFTEFGNSVTELFKLTNKDLVIDIGSNVGVLLEAFKNAGTRILGVDPAPNICEIANKGGIPTMNAFFNEKTAEKVLAEHGAASVITGSNVFAHIDDLHDFMKGIKKLLVPERGVMIIEAPHLLHLIESIEYDTIYHEHYSYISIEPLIPFVERFGMELIRVDQKDIHGGSIRFYVSGKGNYPVHESVGKILAAEKKAKIRDIKTLQDFALKVEKNRQDLRILIAKLKSEGKRIVAVSAPAKGMTLLNYVKLGRESLDYVTEKSMLKIGRYTPGDNIPVYPDSKLMEDKPDYALLLAWNFSAEIIKNLSDYQKAGGKFIIPIPEPKIV